MTSSHQPTRTCLGCRRRRPKREMVRLVRRATGHVDADGAADGRGAYVCAEMECLERALKPLSDGNVLKAGDVIRLETGGGGGWGHPFDREPWRAISLGQWMRAFAVDGPTRGRWPRA